VSVALWKMPPAWDSWDLTEDLRDFTYLNGVSWNTWDICYAHEHTYVNEYVYDRECVCLFINTQ